MTLPSMRQFRAAIEAFKAPLTRTELDPGLHWALRVVDAYWDELDAEEDKAQGPGLQAITERLQFWIGKQADTEWDKKQ